MKTIKKKILPQYFDDILYHNKRFELRKDEDNVQVGDKLWLLEWEDGKYTRRAIQITAKYVLRDCEQYGLKSGYCIIGFGCTGFIILPAENPDALAEGLQ